MSVRWASVGAITIAALAHLPVIAPHLEEAPYMGVLFIALTVACLVIGAVIAGTNADRAHLAAATVCGSAVLGYIATRLVAFPEIGDDVGNWFEPLGVVAVLAESVVVALAFTRMLTRFRDP